MWNNTNRADFAFNTVALGLCLISITAASLVASLMHFNSKLMEHPGKLIFLMCICEAISVWATLMQVLNIQNVICYLGIDQQLLSVVPWWITTQEQAINVLERTNTMICHYFQLLSLCLNFCLCLDIVLTMSNPFSPHDRRMKFYLLGCVPSAAVLTKFMMSSSVVYYFAGNATILTKMQSQAAIGVVFLSIYILYASFSVAYAYRLNTRPGFSAGIRGAFIN